MGEAQVDGIARSGLRSTSVPFTAGDGLELDLIHVEGDRPPSRGPVILVHGAGVRANIFRAPVATTIVDTLVDHGYDVWLENWRGSIEIAPNRWTLDQAALFDHPKAVEKVVEETGADEVKAVIHCQGSTSFTMSVVAGLVPQVKTVVSNAVSLHPVIPDWSRTKLKWSLPILAKLTDYLNPHWGVEAPTLTAKLVSLVVRLTHHECDNDVCKQVSFTYGSGFPALWSHENLNDSTHEWVKQEFKHVPISFFQQIYRCVRAGHLIAVEGYAELPKDFAAEEPSSGARFAFFAGEDNLCFLPVSQVRSYDYFDHLRKDFHSLHVLAGYGHLDMFMGQNAARDVFPLMIDELDKPNA